jgi:sugar lactone lactonase YvrE
MTQEGPVVSVFATGLDHPEGLAFAPDGALWAGGEEGQIYIVSADGKVTEHARTGGFSGGLAFDRDGTCFVCNSSGRIVRVEQDGRWKDFADAIGGVPMRTPNYPVFGPDGSLYVSESGSWDVADGVIYRFPPGAPATSGEVFHAGPFQYTNGLAIDAAGEYLYIVESALHSIARLRMADGAAAVPEPVCRQGSLEWVPDGIALDSTGALYVTTYSSSRIYRIEPGGEPEILVEDVLGMSLNRPTNCAFGGQDLDRLFVSNLGGYLISVIDGIGRRGQPLYAGPGAG